MKCEMPFYPWYSLLRICKNKTLQRGNIKQMLVLVINYIRFFVVKNSGLFSRPKQCLGIDIWIAWEINFSLLIFIYIIT